MTSATDLITYIGVPLTVMGVIPILYNALQALFIRYRLLQSLPPAARLFINFHLNPVGGTVLCTFRKPTLDLTEILANVKHERSCIDIISVDHFESEGLSASWMSLILAINLKPQRKKQSQRMLVDSSLDVDAIAVECNWKTMLFIALGLGVSPADPSFHGLRNNKPAVSEQSLRSLALHSDDKQPLMEIGWHEGKPSFELTEQCSTWSIRRALAHFLHMVVETNGRQQILHFVPELTHVENASTTQICDCKDMISGATKPSILKNVHFALTWTLYFEEIKRRSPSDKISVPQSLLLKQFEVTENLRQMPREALNFRASRIFPNNESLATVILAALEVAWSSSEHQNLLSGLSGESRPLSAATPQQAGSYVAFESREPSPNRQERDLEKATHTEAATDNPSSFDFLPTLTSSPVFASISSTYNPFSATESTKTDQTRRDVSGFSPSSSSAPTAGINDSGTPEGFLALLMIALSSMRQWVDGTRWDTSIASGNRRYIIGPRAGEDSARQLVEYEDATFRFQ